MIVVFGSLNVDIVLSVPRLPAPGETVINATSQLVPGGKGANQAAAAGRSGGIQTAMFGRVGDDDWATTATALLPSFGVDISGLGRSEQPTGAAAVLVDQAGENAIVVASGANQTATADLVPDRCLGPDCWLILQMEVPLAENWALVDRARAAGSRIVLNLAPIGPVPDAVLSAIDFLILNEGEALALCRDKAIDATSDAGRVMALARRYGTTTIVTLGSDGAVAADGIQLWRQASLTVSAIDTTGAGDGFVGAFTVALAEGADLASALRQGCVAAALSCTVFGAQTSYADAETIARRLAEVAPAELGTINHGEQ